MFKGLVAAAALMLSASFANADVQDLYTCGLKFKATGKEMQILVGKSKIEGTGKIVCKDVHGNKQTLPVKVKMSAPCIFPRIAISPELTVYGVATGIGVANGPEALLGRYLALDAHVAVGAGAGTTLALHGNDNALTFNLGLQGMKGLGIGAGAVMIKITALND